MNLKIYQGVINCLVQVIKPELLKKGFELVNRYLVIHFNLTIYFFKKKFMTGLNFTSLLEVYEKMFLVAIITQVIITFLWRVYVKRQYIS